MVPLKRKLTNKTVFENFIVLRDLGKGISNKRVTEKYSLPGNAVSAYVKKQGKVVSFTGEKGYKL